MSRLADIVTSQRKKMLESATPPELESRVSSTLEEILRLETDIGSRVYVEQMLRWVDWVLHLPWNERTTDKLDIEEAKRELEKNHYGLLSVKDRILEYLSVLKLTQSTGSNESIKESSTVNLAKRAPILCLVGLVGTGKTTLAKSVARAMGRQFIRIPFGGMSDSLELRGQSRVRPDAEIGKILKGLRFAGTKNPVILLDEIDRVAEHARGDIMGVLVELLDPEQNMAFTDHYLDYPFDLSECLFIATANNTTHIATAVMDRLEPIQMPSYTDEEKIKIGKEYVFPHLRQQSGLREDQLTIDDAIWGKVVRPLGYDSGIRSLERTINALCRKVARIIVEKRAESVRVSEENIKEFLEVY
jgi:ATP-dependent Lon protease